MVVLSGELFYAGLDNEQPNTFLMEALHACECPVMVIPENYTPPQQGLSEKKHVLMVSGSFGRSPFSYTIKHSFSEQVIHDHKVPVFIAHG